MKWLIGFGFLAAFVASALVVLYLVVTRTHWLGCIKPCTDEMALVPSQVLVITERMTGPHYEPSVKPPIDLEFGDGGSAVLSSPADRIGLDVEFSDGQTLEAWTYYDYGLFEQVTLAEDSVLRVYTPTTLLHTDFKLSFVDLASRTSGVCRLTEAQWNAHLHH